MAVDDCIKMRFKNQAFFNASHPCRGWDDEIIFSKSDFCPTPFKFMQKQ
ncbi:hypothetical protein [Staphylococcus arlettae]|nr:hypothetical protein [Staphylococcus arlettae]